MKQETLIRSYSLRIERVKVKAFKDSDTMHKFLGTGANALTWREVSGDEYANGLRKAGVYIERGIGKSHEFLNVKSIDPSALAHMR